jgi:hypothetical protein
MTLLRLILFIPAFFLALFIGNFLIELIFYLINFFQSIDDSPLSFIWDYFIKSFLLTLFAIMVGSFTYPYKNKLFPLILFSLFYLGIFIAVFIVFNRFWNELNESGTKVLASQISIVLGSIIGLGIIWNQSFKSGFENFD